MSSGFLFSLLFFSPVLSFFSSFDLQKEGGRWWLRSDFIQCAPPGVIAGGPAEGSFSLCDVMCAAAAVCCLLHGRCCFTI